MASFAFKKELTSGAKAHATMSEAMSLEGDHVAIQYTTEFEGMDLGVLSHKLRKVSPEYSDEARFQRDVQMLIDENYINSLLFAQFYSEKVFSLTETLLDLIPDNLTGGTFFLRPLMSSQVWRPYFPGLATYRTDQRVDFRCGFG